MNVDTLLRETLQSYADQAPRNAGLLDAAQDRADERRRHRHLATAGMAVVAVVAVGVAGWAVWAGPARQPALPAEQSVLVEPSFELPAFPFTPGWFPEGSAEPYVSVDGPIATLVHPHQDGALPVMTVYVEQPVNNVLYERFGLTGSDSGAVTVRGQPAGLYCCQAGVGGGVYWRDGTDRLVLVASERLQTLPDMARYAEELMEEPLPVTPPFTFDLLPVGAEPVVMRRDAVSFALQDGDQGTGLGELTVALRDRRQSDARLYSNAGFWGEHHRERIRVGDHAAEYREGVGVQGLRVFLPDGLVLDVHAFRVPTLSRDDLVRLAAGVQLMPHAAPAR